MRGIAVPGGRRKETPDTLLRDFRGRWKAGWDTWNAFAGKLCQVGGKRCYLTRFRRETVPGGRRDMPPGTLLRDFRARWRRDETPGTLSRDFRARWAAGKGHLTRFCGDSVAGGKRDGTPDTILQGFRARWEAGKDTWNTFAGFPSQVEGGKRHLEHFRRDSVAGGRREETPGTLSQGFRGRWTAGKDT